MNEATIAELVGWARRTMAHDRIGSPGKNHSHAIINKTIGNPLFFLRYLPPKPSRVSQTPHSHSIVSDHRNALNYKPKFFLGDQAPSKRTVRIFGF